MRKNVKFWVVHVIVLFSLMGILSCMIPEPENTTDDTTFDDDRGLTKDILISEGFESGDFSANPWTLGGDANPIVQSSVKHNGTYALQFGDVSHNQLSTIEISNVEATSVTFWYKVSSENNYDFFKFYVDGSVVKQESGEVSWTEYTYELGSGTHTLKWVYEKDYSVSNGSDTAYIDDIVIEGSSSGGSTEAGWTENFETGDWSSQSWTGGGDENPVVQSSVKHNGTYAAKFGNISHNQSSYFQISVDAVGTSSIAFWYKVSSENNYDFFNFYVDGNKVKNVSGEVSWTEYTYDLTEGTHTLKWEYAKDYSVSNGSDTAYIDDIVFTTEDGGTQTYPEINVTGTTDFGSVDVGNTTSNTYTIENTGDAELNLTGSPIVEISGSSAFTVTSQASTPISAGGSTTFTIEFAPTTAGSDSADVSIANDDSDENPYTFTVTGEAVDNSTPTSGLDEDFESGDFSANQWTLGGDANPFVQSSVKYSGNYASEFGNISDNQTSYFEITDIEVNEASKLKFWYKVSSETSYDFFKFYVNGTEVLDKSGEVSWTKYSYELATGTTYTFKWAFEKDGSVSNGSDTAYIDDILVYSLADAEPEISVSGNQSFGDVTVDTTVTKTYTIENLGEGSLELTGSPIVEISGSSAFTVNTQPSTPVSAGSSTTFTIDFTPTTLTTETATVSIANNDSDENPYTFNIDGNGVEQSAGNGEWLFMFYMDGDNNLESALWGDVNEIEKGLYDMSSELRSKVNVIVLWDGTSSYSSGGPDTGYLYELGTDNVEDTTLSSNTTTLTDGWFTNGTEIDMGDGNTLTNLINYSRNRYPNAEHEVLIMSNHGGGVRDYKGEHITPDRYGWSDDDNGTHLYTNEIQTALINAGADSNKLEILGMDACLMSMVEEAYEYRNLADYFVASVMNEQGDGWEFNDWMPNMTTSSTPREVAQIIVESYRDDIGTYDQTLTATDLSQVANVKTAMDNLADAMANSSYVSTLKSIMTNTEHTYDHYFIGDLCKRIIDDSSIPSSIKTEANDVLTALGNAVVYAWSGSGQCGGYDGTGTQVQEGLAVLSKVDQPWYTDGPYSDHGYLDWCTTTNDGVVNTWAELLSAWY